jgi:KDO2-lipid IV(A) lauroyltransferase
MAFSRISSEKLLDMVEFENLELAKKIIKNGKGTILLTAHYGNWELGALAMGLVLDKEIGVLVKKQRNKLVAEWISRMRERFTNKEVPLGVSVRELFKILNNGGVIGIVGDQRAPKKDAVVVNFFNIPTATFQGFSALGIKKKVPILVVLSERLNNGKYKIKISEISYNDLPENLSEQIKELNQRYMSILEEQIKKVPEQWLWMHKIWKY